MKNTNDTLSSLSADLRTFISKFEPRNFKALSRGIEVRGASDIHRSVAFAKEVITKTSLNLSVVHTAEMAGYGAFEVRDAS
ncbi:MAG: hypothetical protein EOO90_17390 [Pedobacter sp.]|nr:MAG: hypothetical protein EOO90_17390 [Pedobacter sp.]